MEQICAQTLLALAEELRGLSPQHLARLCADGLPPPEEPDFRRRHYRIAEYAAALELGLVPWPLMPPDLLEEHDLARWGPGGLLLHPDYGVDAMSLDAATTAQIKWYAPDSAVSFRALGTFFLLSSVLRARRRVVVPTAGVAVHRLAARASRPFLAGCGLRGSRGSCAARSPPTRTKRGQ